MDNKVIYKEWVFDSIKILYKETDLWIILKIHWYYSIKKNWSQGLNQYGKIIDILL